MMMPTKSPNMMSTTGRRPVMAAPTPMPVNPASEMGVSSTRSGPNSSTRPFRTLKAVPASATSSPITKTRGSRRNSSARASRTASPSVSSRTALLVNTAASGIHVLGDALDRRIGGGDRELHGLLHLRLHCGVDLVELSLGRRAFGEQPVGFELDRVALGLPNLLFLLGAIVVAGDVAHVMAS